MNEDRCDAAEPSPQQKTLMHTLGRTIYERATFHGIIGAETLPEQVEDFIETVANLAMTKAEHDPQRAIGWVESLDEAAWDRIGRVYIAS